MRTTLFNLLRYPQTLDRLYAELSSANVSYPYPSYSEVRDLPYLEACVQEGVRMHPPFALPFERVVPEGGVTVLGHHLPAGTVVGGSPYVINRHKQTFGEDAEIWRPERWLDKDEGHKKRLEQSMLTVSLIYATLAVLSCYRPCTTVAKATLSSSALAGVYVLVSILEYWRSRSLYLSWSLITT